MNRLLLYRNFEHEELIYRMKELAEKVQEGNVTEKDLETYTDCIHEMIEMAASYGLQENLWHSVLACILANAENAFSKACEKKGLPQGSLAALVLSDISFWRALFDIRFESLDEAFGCSLAGLLESYVNSNTNGHVFNKRIRDSITGLGKALGACKDDAEFLNTLTGFYRDYGVGMLGLHKAFRIGQDKNGEAVIEPITCTEHVHLDDLVGYERQKKKLIDNTLSFVNGQAANNVLLFGDAGTGKSSSIKAIMNEFYAKGLRLIEVYKHQFKDLPKIIAQIKNRNYKFIIYMDDLSFEEFEIEYKYLKAVIEGGLETKPDNVLIYATSNRRHLIKESFDDVKDYKPELHSSDTVQEKLSLVARFGVTIYFGAPEKQEYDDIVVTLARKAGIEMDTDALLLEAGRWELNHGGRSGRCAQQFIIYLLGQRALKDEEKKGGK